MDIVKRLRQEIAGYTDGPIEAAEATMHEAADEIVRLRKELKRVNDGIDAFKDSIKWKHDNWLKIKPIFEQNKQPLNHKYEDIPSRFSKFFDNPALKEGE